MITLSATGERVRVIKSESDDPKMIVTVQMPNGDHENYSCTLLRAWGGAIEISVAQRIADMEIGLIEVFDHYTGICPHCKKRSFLTRYDDGEESLALFCVCKKVTEVGSKSMIERVLSEATK